MKITYTPVKLDGGLYWSLMMSDRNLAFGRKMINRFMLSWSRGRVRQRSRSRISAGCTGFVSFVVAAGQSVSGRVRCTCRTLGSRICFCSAFIHVRVWWVVRCTRIHSFILRIRWTASSCISSCVCPTASVSLPTAHSNPPMWAEVKPCCCSDPCVCH